MLFVHGAWHGAWCWDEYFLPYFARHGYPAYALSLRGHGQSEGKAGRAGLPEYLEDIHQVAAEIGEPAVIVGHSMGGYLVLKYLEKYPAAGGVLLAAMSPAGVPSSWRKYGRPLYKLANLALRGAPMPIPKNPHMLQKMLFSPEMPTEQVRRYARWLQNEALGFFFDYLLLEQPDPQKLKKLPMLVQRPTRDLMRERLCGPEIAQLYQGSYHEYPAIAHDMMLDPRWQEVAADMLEWLASLPSATRP